MIIIIIKIIIIIIIIIMIVIIILIIIIIMIVIPISIIIMIIIPIIIIIMIIVIIRLTLDNNPVRRLEAGDLSYVPGTPQSTQSTRDFINLIQLDLKISQQIFPAI